MLFIVYGATLDLGYETREIFRKKGFSIISKYNHVRDDAKVDKKNYENTADSNEWFQKWYDDKVYISEEELEMLDFTYGLDGVCVGFNQKQIVDAVRGVTDSLITLGASSLGFITELKAAYGDYVTVIHLFEDVLTVEQSVVKCTAYNIAYTGSDCELRLCYFESIDTFQDWKTFELYKIPIFESNVTELDELRFEAPVEVCLWQGKAYFAATMERRIIEELLDDEIVFTKWEPELVDVFIEDEGRAWELVEFSFFSKYANPLYPEETCSPLGMIVGKFHM